MPTLDTPPTFVLFWVCTGGRQRSEAEFRRLYETAGLRLTRIVSTAMPVKPRESSRERRLPHAGHPWFAQHPAAILESGRRSP